ncbi:MAG: response regulator, partial [Candidatus Omnitrophota bacterium]
LTVVDKRLSEFLEELQSASSPAAFGGESRIENGKSNVAPSANGRTVAAEQLAACSLELAAHEASSPVKILVVGSSSFVGVYVLRPLKRMLYELPVKFISAANGKEALARCQTDNFDFVITSIDMPEMDGLQFAAALRKRESYKTTPIFVVSSQSPRDYCKLSWALQDSVVNRSFLPFNAGQELAEVIKKSIRASSSPLQLKKLLFVVTLLAVFAAPAFAQTPATQPVDSAYSAYKARQDSLYRQLDSLAVAIDSGYASYGRSLDTLMDLTEQAIKDATLLHAKLDSFLRTKKASALKAQARQDSLFFVRSMTTHAQRLLGIKENQPIRIVTTEARLPDLEGKTIDWTAYRIFVQQNDGAYKELTAEVKIPQPDGSKKKQSVVKVLFPQTWGKIEAGLATIEKLPQPDGAVKEQLTLIDRLITLEYFVRESLKAQPKEEYRIDWSKGIWIPVVVLAVIWLAIHLWASAEKRPTNKDDDNASSPLIELPTPNSQLLTNSQEPRAKSYIGSSPINLSQQLQGSSPLGRVYPINTINNSNNQRPQFLLFKKEATALAARLKGGSDYEDYIMQSIISLQKAINRFRGNKISDERIYGLGRKMLKLEDEFSVVLSRTVELLKLMHKNWPGLHCESIFSLISNLVAPSARMELVSERIKYGQSRIIAMQKIIDALLSAGYDEAKAYSFLSEIVWEFNTYYSSAYWKALHQWLGIQFDLSSIASIRKFFKEIRGLNIRYPE